MEQVKENGFVPLSHLLGLQRGETILSRTHTRVRPQACHKGRSHAKLCSFFFLKKYIQKRFTKESKLGKLKNVNLVYKKERAKNGKRK